MSSDVVEYSDVVYTKNRLVAEWNYNRFAHNLTRPGEVIMYQGPGDDFEHPLYVDKVWNMLPVDRATGKPMYVRINSASEAPDDYEGISNFPTDLVVDRDGDYVRHYGDNTYVTINDVRIAVGSDDVEVTDENGDPLKVSPDGKVIPLGDEGLPLTTVQNGEEVVLNTDGSVMTNDITGAPVKLAEILELDEAKAPVSVVNRPRRSDGTLQDPSRGTRYFDYDSDLFPLDSIIEPDRPKKKGLQKAWARSKNRTQSYTSDFYYPGRFYTASVDAKFKYWVPNDAASLTKKGGDNAGYPIQDIGVWVNYDRPLLANKIVIGVDPVMNEAPEEKRRWAEPTWSRVYIEVDDGGGRPRWLVVKENPTLNEDGKIILYCNSADYRDEWVDANSPDMTGDWEPDLALGLHIMSIRYEVYRMAEPGVRLNLVEMSLRLERDLSDRLATWSSDAAMSDHSFVAPFGRLSSNTASVTLNNMDGQFDTEAKYLLNDSMLGDIVSTRRNELYKMVDRGIEMRLDLAVSDRPIEDGPVDWERQFTMTTDNWSLSDGMATAELKDDSELLQRLKPGPVFIEQFRRSKKGRPVKLTAMEVIFQLLDLVGYNNIRIKGDYDKTVPMDFYWTDGEATVWDCITSICESTQMSVYFDRFGVMQFQPLKTLYDEPKGVDKAVLRTVDVRKPSDPNGYYPANIESLNRDGEYEANTINITYKQTHLAETTDSGIEKLQQVWEPQGTQTLRASALVAPLDNLDRGKKGADYSLKIAAGDAKSWPFEGIVNVEGELIRYNAKKYYYYNSNGKYRHKYVKSQEEVDKLDELNPKLSFKNHYNGRLRIKERGLWNTHTKAHKVDINGWWCRKRTGNGRVVEWRGGIKHDKNNSALLLRAPKSFKKNSIYVAMNGDMDDAPINYYGCRMKYPKSGYSYGAAGIAVGLGTHDCGIYIELARTSAVSKEKRKQGNELRIWLRQKNGKFKRWGKGEAVPVARAKWYDIDVFYAKQGNDYLVQVMVNGVSQHNFRIDNPDSNQFDGLNGARYGMFVRGNSHADFEYFYACNKFEQEGLDEAGGFFDRINNGWQSQSSREYTLRHRKHWRYNKRKNERVRARYDQLLFDDFGPIVHEVREYDVKFDTPPATFSKLYFTNDSQAYCTEYSHNAFGAKFIMANGSRNNAVLNGEDTLTYGKDNTLNQKMIIFGRAVQQDDESRIVLRDEGAVARRGEVSLDFNTDWVQSESAAKALASYILGAWSRPSYGYSVTIFGDPRLDLGDRVALYAPEQGIGAEGMKYSDVKKLNTYIINEIHQDYDSGLTTTLNLRSVNPAPAYESVDESELLTDNNLIFNAKMNQHDGDDPTGWIARSGVDASYVLTHEPSFGNRVGLLKVRGTYDNGTKNPWVHSYVEPQRYMPGQTEPVRRFPYVKGDYYHAEVRVHAMVDSYVGLRIYGYGGAGGENNGQIAMEKVRVRAGETKTIKIDGKFTKSGLTEVVPLVYFFKADGKHGAVKRSRFYISRMFFQTGEDETDTKPTW